MLTGESNVFRAGAKILEMGPRFIVIKKGEHGAFLLSNDYRFALPAYPVEHVVDPTGAGDSFAGGFMGYLAMQDKIDPATMRKAMLFGTVTASISVEGFSVDALARHDLDSLKARYEDLHAFFRV